MNSIGTVHGWAFGRWTAAPRAAPNVPDAVSAALGRGGGGRSAFTTLADAVAKGLGIDGGATSGDRSFDGLALALRDALAAGDGSAGAVDGVLKKVSDALGAARSTLIANGTSERDADRAIAAFQSKLADAVEALAAKTSAVGAPATATVPGASATDSATPPAADVPAPATTAFQASGSVDRKLGIRLVTQEGDVVRIRLRQSEGFEAGAAQRGAAAYAAVSAYATSRFTIDVQGSLSDTELKAIGDVLGQVDRIAAEFYSGDVATAFADAASLDVDPAVLAKVGLKMSQTQSLRVAGVNSGALAAPAATQTPTPVSAVPPPPAPPAAEPGSTSPDATTDAAASAASDAAGASPSAPAASDPAPTTPANPPPTTSSADAVRKSVLDFMRDLLDTLGTTTQAGRVTITARAKLELAVVAIDGARSPSVPAEKAATGLLAGTVSSLRDA